MSNEQIFYVYVYLDPRKPGKYVYGEFEFEYEPFYVGKGHGIRSNHHLYEGAIKNNKNRSFVNKIKKIQRICNYNPFVLIYKDRLDENSAFGLEISMITTIGRNDLNSGPLCNLTNGGEGVSGLIYNDEHRKKMSECRKGKRMGIENSMYGKPRPDLSKRNKLIRLTGSKNPRAVKRIILEIETNKIFHIDCLKDFCKDQNINYHSMKTALHYNRSYKGFKIIFSQKELPST